MYTKFIVALLRASVEAFTGKADEDIVERFDTVVAHECCESFISPALLLEKCMLTLVRHTLKIMAFRFLYSHVNETSAQGELLPLLTLTVRRPSVRRPFKSFCEKQRGRF